jgi:hypothetical protein
MSRTLPSHDTEIEDFGPLFACLKDRAPEPSPTPIPKREVVDLATNQLKFVSWLVFAETEEGLILRDGVEHWMELTLWKAGETLGCGFALRHQDVEYEFAELLDTRPLGSKPREPDPSRLRAMKTQSNTTPQNHF